MLKSRDITLPKKVHLVKAMVFPIVRYGCDSWTIKKAECQRTDAFKLWCWGRLWRVSWTRRSNQSILKEFNPEYSLEEIMLKLKLQYFSHLMWTANSLEKTLMLRKIEGRRRRGQQRMRRLNGITDSMDMSLSKLGSWWWTGRPGVLQSKGLQSWTQLSDWTETRCSGKSHNIPGLPDKSVSKDTLWPQTVLPCIFKAFLFYFLHSFCPASTNYRNGIGTSYPVPFLHTTSKSILNVCCLSKLNT